MQDETYMSGSRFNEIVSEVITAHGFTHEQVANFTGINRSYITRVLNGQHPVTAEMVRALWNKTSDQRLALLAFGEGVLAVAMQEELAKATPAEICQRVMHGFASLQQQLIPITAGQPGSVTHDCIDDLLGLLAALRRRSGDLDKAA